MLRYAFSYRPMPEAIVWLEIGPLLELPEEDALSAWQSTWSTKNGQHEPILGYFRVRSLGEWT